MTLAADTFTTTENGAAGHAALFADEPGDVDRDTLETAPSRRRSCPAVREAAGVWSMCLLAEHPPTVAHVPVSTSAPTPAPF